MPLIPFGEYRPDVSDYEQAFTEQVNNVLPRGDGYGPSSAFAAYSAGLPGTCRGFFKAIKTDGSVAIFAATATKLFQLNNTSQTWTDVSKLGGSYSSVSSTDQWQFVQYINFVIAVQANTPPQYFDLTSSTAFADLAGSPPQARYVSVVGAFVVLSGLPNNPYRVQWSALGDPTGWAAGVNSSSFQDMPDGGIVRGVAGGEYGNIFQDTAIRRLVYAPGSPVIFQIERISDDRGLYAPYSLIRSGDRIFFLAAQGFMTMSPSGYPQPIGKERVDRTFKADVDTSNLQLVLGASDPRYSRVFWAYKSGRAVRQAALLRLRARSLVADRAVGGISRLAVAARAHAGEPRQHFVIDRSARPLARQFCDLGHPGDRRVQCQPCARLPARRQPRGDDRDLGAGAAGPARVRARLPAGDRRRLGFRRGRHAGTADRQRNLHRRERHGCDRQLSAARVNSVRAWAYPHPSRDKLELRARC
jgi:hypothetical protein